MNKSIALAFVVAMVVGASAAPASANGGLNILLTNDDGYGSYGIETMRDALVAAGHTVYVSAPASQQSGKSGAITADYGAIVQYNEEVAGEEWSIVGVIEDGETSEATPADSVSAGLFGLTPGVLPSGETIDLVVSGINDGENISRFANASGTVGAAMWALRRGVPSIAVSVGQDITALAAISGCFKGELDDLGCYCDVRACLYPQVIGNARIGAQRAAALAVDVIDELGPAGLLPGFGLNINVPSGRFSPVGVQVTRSDNNQAFDLVVATNDDGELEVDNLVVDQYLVGLMVSQVPVQACPSLPLDLDSEGAAFACAYNTISIFDGNFDASQDTSTAAEQIACSLDDIATMPTYVNCACYNDDDDSDSDSDCDSDSDSDSD